MPSSSMNAYEFLAKILPPTGVFYIATLAQGAERTYFKHAICESPAHAAQMALHLDAQGESVYHACAAYREHYIDVDWTDPKTGVTTTKKRQRVQKNVQSVRAFWLDLDVEPGNPSKYPSQSAALNAMGAFIKSTGLPVPMFVSSGYGIHIYWPLVEAVQPAQWQACASLLKALTQATGLITDPSRTSDSASVLRPPGTHNRKGGSVVPVQVIRDAEPVLFSAFHDAVVKACEGAKVEPPKAPTMPKGGVNDQYLIPTDYPPSRAGLVADKCQQIRTVRDTKGNVPEPVWYSAIQVLFHTIESESIIHEWSCGHPAYTPAETARKVDQIRSMGPTTCKTFNERNPEGCLGCPFAGKITSPIQLGAKVEALPPAVVESHPGIPETRAEIPNPPAPFVRSKDGVFVEVADGAIVRVHAYDIFPTELMWDEHVGYETATIRHFLPLEGWKEFSLPTYLVERPVDFLQHMRKYHVKPGDGKLLVKYMSAYLEEIQKRRNLKKLYMSMGWKEEDSWSFVLGEKLYTKEGTVLDAGMSAKVSSTLTGFHTKGSLDLWTNATALLDGPGMEAHAFSLSLAFGAPLLNLMNHRGVVFSMLGETGAGKSTLGLWGLSVYGKPEALALSHDDTVLARLERIGLYANLPVYMDESSTMDPKIVSELAYTFTKGEGRKRLKADASERGALKWSTFLITSTNQSLQSKLEAAKNNSKAEAVRVFEYEMPVFEHMKKAWALVNEMTKSNYGHAGEIYVRWLAQNSAKAAVDVKKLEEHLAQLSNAKGEERFWLAGCACSIYGAMVARALGLVKYDPTKLIAWVVHKLRSLRVVVSDGRIDEVGLLGLYLDEHTNSRIVVGGGHPNSGYMQVYIAPRAALTARLELDTRLIYISRTHLKQWITKQGEDYTRVKQHLMSIGLLRNADARKVLGAGTDYGSTQIPCWMVKLDHPVLGAVAAVAEAAAAEKKP